MDHTHNILRQSSVFFERGLLVHNGWMSIWMGVKFADIDVFGTVPAQQRELTFYRR